MNAAVRHAARRAGRFNLYAVLIVLVIAGGMTVKAQMAKTSARISHQSEQTQP